MKLKVKLKTLWEETTAVRRETDESGKFLKSTVGWTTSEQFEEIRQLQTSLHQTEESLDQVTLGPDCSESLVKRLSPQIRALQEIVNVSREAAEFTDLELAISEVSEHTFTRFFRKRNHVSEANFIGQPQLKTLLQAAMSVNRQFVNSTPMEDRSRASTDSRSIPQIARSLPNVMLPPSVHIPSRSTFESPRRSPNDVSCGVNGIREISHTLNVQLLAVELKNRSLFWFLSSF